jgi:hypothetical protein
MSEPVVSAGDTVTIPRRNVERDLRVSLVLLVCGIGLHLVWVGLAATGVLLSGSALHFASYALLADLLSGAGGIVIFIVAIFAAVNGSLL